MAPIQRLRPQGLLSSPAFSHVAIVPPGATLGDVVQWTVLFVDGADLAAGYGAIASELASEEPALVTAARVAGLGVPGALVEISAVAAVVR
jgi:enamine deaminase RidA (YjgF/YER057c/UK114 family)